MCERGICYVELDIGGVEYDEEDANGKKEHDGEGVECAEDAAKTTTEPASHCEVDFQTNKRELLVI